MAPGKPHPFHNATCTPGDTNQAWQTYRDLPHRATIKILSANMTIRREVLCVLVDIKTTRGRCVLKTANVLDRALRTKNSAARNRATALTINACSYARNQRDANLLGNWEVLNNTTQKNEIISTENSTMLRWGSPPTQGWLQTHTDRGTEFPNQKKK